MSEPTDYQAAVLVEESTPYKVSGRKHLPHQFTTENARDMNAKAQEAKRQRAAEQRERDLCVLADSHKDEYVKGQLVRVREHIARLDVMLEKAKEPADIDKLARARAVLSEEERKLDGRPLPGAFRPSKARSASAPSAEIV